MKKASLLSMLFLSVLLFPGCVTSQQTEVTPPSFNASGYDTLRINARKLEIIENWQMPMEAPHIEHMLEPTMSGLIVDWASRILVPIGGSGELILTISKASVTVGELAKEADFVSLFKPQFTALTRPNGYLSDHYQKKTPKKKTAVLIASLFTARANRASFRTKMSVF